MQLKSLHWDPFQHESAPVHKARTMKTWFAVEELAWPAHSPDLNPVEPLCGGGTVPPAAFKVFLPTSVPDLVLT